MGVTTINVVGAHDRGCSLQHPHRGAMVCLVLPNTGHYRFRPFPGVRFEDQHACNSLLIVKYPPPPGAAQQY